MPLCALFHAAFSGYWKRAVHRPTVSRELLGILHFVLGVWAGDGGVPIDRHALLNLLIVLCSVPKSSWFDRDEVLGQMLGQMAHCQHRQTITNMVRFMALRGSRGVHRVEAAYTERQYFWRYNTPNACAAWFEEKRLPLPSSFPFVDDAVIDSLAEAIVAKFAGGGRVDCEVDHDLAPGSGNNAVSVLSWVAALLFPVARSRAFIFEKYTLQLQSRLQPSEVMEVVFTSRASHRKCQVRFTLTEVGEL